jgi:hypothetical protein
MQLTSADRFNTFLQHKYDIFYKYTPEQQAQVLEFNESVRGGAVPLRLIYIDLFMYDQLILHAQQNVRNPLYYNSLVRNKLTTQALIKSREALKESVTPDLRANQSELKFSEVVDWFPESVRPEIRIRLHDAWQSWVVGKIRASELLHSVLALSSHASHSPEVFRVVFTIMEFLSQYTI